MNSKLLKEVKQLTAANQHNLSRLALARVVHNNNLAMAYSGLEAVCTCYGRTPDQVFSLRRELDIRLKYSLYEYYKSEQTTADQLWGAL
jgi:hypothetical protein